MAINIDGKIFRNIQEQVQKNKDDIAAWSNIQFTLNNFGVRVLGIATGDPNEPGNLPASYPDEFEPGDAYLVETEESTAETPIYDMWIYTSIYNEEGEFINMGVLNAIGPQGPAGTVSVGTVTTGSAGSSASVTNSGSPSNAVLDFTIPKGDTGATGNGIQSISKTSTYDNVDTYTITFTNGQTTTFTVTNGINGSNGPQGDPGQSFVIMGTINNTSLLPDPSETPRNYAYVYSDGSIATPDRLYYITGAAGSEVWEYCSFASVGTTVTVNSSPVSTFDADTKQDVINSSNKLDYSLVANTPSPITITTTSGSQAISDGTNTLTFGENAFSNTAIPTTYVTSVNGNSGVVANIATTSDLADKLDANKCTIQYSTPTANITDGGVHIVYLPNEPSTYYTGYIYFIYDPSV